MRSYRRDGCMAWTGVSSRGKTPLVFINGNMDGVEYVQMLDDNLIPLMENKHLEHDEHTLHQHDYAACHTGKVAHDYFVCVAHDDL